MPHHLKGHGWMVGAGAALLLATSTSIASAQSLADQSRSSDGPTSVISANPFLPLFGYFSGEFEHSIKSSVAIAVAGSHIKFDNGRYSNLDVKLRLYPTERGLEGFNVAASLGIANIKDDGGYYADCVFDPVTPSVCQSGKERFGTGAFGIEMGYQWLLGPTKVMAVAIGGGAKRYMASKEKFQFTQQVVPTLRLTIGYAF